MAQQLTCDWLLFPAGILLKIDSISLPGAVFMILEWKRDPYLISTDKQKLDVTVIHTFLSQSYWANNVPVEVLRQAIDHSLNFGVYKGDQQVGFARVITDYATFAYVADVFILEGFRGQGLSKWLMQSLVDHPQLQGLRRWLLFTRDAHGLYQQVGFTPPKWPERVMERFFPDIYQH
jgi:GNAT superfamily N-acetyltransferase